MKKIALSTAVLLAVAFVIVVSSCVKGGASKKDSEALILFINAAVNTSGLDFYLNSTKENTTPIAYPGASPSYQTITAGPYTFKANLDSTGSNIIDTPVNFAGATAYSVFVINTTPNYSTLILMDTVATPASGTAYIRFVDLVVNAPSYTASLVGSTVSVANLNFSGNSGFVSVAAGSYPVQWAANGGTTNTFNSITLTSGKIYTLSVSGIYGKGLSDLLMEDF